MVSSMSPKTSKGAGAGVDLLRWRFCGCSLVSYGAESKSDWSRVFTGSALLLWAWWLYGFWIRSFIDFDKETVL